MTIAVGDPVFVDTNVLMYANLAHSPFHVAAKDKLLELDAAGHPLCASRQILREYLGGMSRPSLITPPIPITTLASHVRQFESQFLIVEDDSRVTDRLLDLLTQVACLGKQVHDANIVATMLTHKIPNLVTHNVADFNRFATFIKVIPLI